MGNAAVVFWPRLALRRKIDRFTDIVEARLQMFPLLTAQRLFEERDQQV